MKWMKLRNKNYYLQATDPKSRKQTEISLRTKDRKVAITRCRRFMTTLEETGSWDVARSQLLGKNAIKKGESPTHEQIAELYQDFNNQSAKKIKDVSFVTNLNSLRRLMKRLNAKTVNDIDLASFKFTDENRKTTASEIRHSKGVFKPSALKFYATRGVIISDPLKVSDLPAVEFEPYRPLSQIIRNSILEGIEDLPSDQALAILLGLKLGLRKSEADRARLSWISQTDNDKFIFSVREEDDFKPKTSHSKRDIPISKSLVDEILTTRRRGNPSSFDPYIIPGGGRGKTRKDKTFRNANQWLKSKGVSNINPYHSCRKEFVSFLITQHGAAVAYKLTGHTDMNLLMRIYGGLTETPLIEFK